MIRCLTPAEVGAPAPAFDDDIGSEYELSAFLTSVLRDFLDYPSGELLILERRSSFRLLIWIDSVRLW